MTAASEHALIIDAIIAGDVDLARSATGVHLQHSLATILDSAEAGRFDPQIPLERTA